MVLQSRQRYQVSGFVSRNKGSQSDVGANEDEQSHGMKDTLRVVRRLLVFMDGFVVRISDQSSLCIFETFFSVRSYYVTDSR